MNIGEVLIQLENLLPGVHISYEVTHMGGCVEKWEHQWAVKEKFGYLVRKLQNKLRVSPAQIAYEMFFTKEYVVIKLQKLNEAELEHQIIEAIERYTGVFIPSIGQNWDVVLNEEEEKFIPAEAGYASVAESITDQPKRNNTLLFATIGVMGVLTETLTNNLTDDVVRIIAKQLKDAFLGFQPHE